MNRVVLSILLIFFVPTLTLQGKSPQDEPVGAKFKNRSCESQSLLVDHRGVQTSFDRLPQKNILFVARKAYFRIYSQSGAPLVESHQNFVKLQATPDLRKCRDDIELGKHHYTLSAPVLIDLSDSDKIGQRIWNFQIVNRQGELKSFNQVSLRPAEHAILRLKEAHQIIQMDHSTVLVEFLTKEGDYQNSLIVEYDLVFKKKSLAQNHPEAFVSL